MDKSVPKNRLPDAVAFKGNERIDVDEAATACADIQNRCTFTVDDAYSYAYYDKARTVLETYIDCTRNPLTHKRPVGYTDLTYDSLRQTTGNERLQNTQDNLHKQFNTGFQKTSPAPWRWTPASNREINEVIQAGEASWIEAQAARQRTDGWFTSTTDNPDQQYRLHITVDGPSGTLADRVYQRTGPMATAEKRRCRSDRPTARTPNGATAHADSTEREG
ncbi:hypothetical protein ACODT5_22100 [Streptomyces sp. 5.8]|uniref:hypothetical protein n=1 Tax=Streptomyces sp. 5.8 TaxID=3406571 RepID=UPI003BB5D565